MYVMVLSDGETYSDLAGCKIVRVNHDLIHDPDRLQLALHELKRQPPGHTDRTLGVKVVEVFGRRHIVPQVAGH